MAKEQETSDFASKGMPPFLNTYEDDKRTVDISSWTPKLVRSKRNDYEGFVQREDIQVRARLVGGRILRHLTFEDEFNKGEESFKNWIEMELLASKVVDDGCEDTSV